MIRDRRGRYCQIVKMLEGDMSKKHIVKNFSLFTPVVYIIEGFYLRYLLLEWILLYVFI